MHRARRLKPYSPKPYSACFRSCVVLKGFGNPESVGKKRSEGLHTKNLILWKELLRIILSKQFSLTGRYVPNQTSRTSDPIKIAHLEVSQDTDQTDPNRCNLLTHLLANAETFKGFACNPSPTAKGYRKGVIPQTEKILGPGYSN